MSQRPLQVKLASTDPRNITAADDAAWITGILGGSTSTVSCILPFGDRLSTVKVDNNTVRMMSGFYSMQGFGIKIPDSEDFTISSGAQGKKRIDLIVAEYQKASERDSYQIKVVQGTQVSSNPEAPTLTEEDLHFGGSLRQEEIARVTINGTDIVSVEVTADIVKGLTALNEDFNNKLGKNEKAADSNLLDGKDLSYYNVPDTVVKRSDSSGSIQVGPIYEDGTLLSDKYLTAVYANSHYLGKNSKAKDSSKLDGKDLDYENTPDTVVKRSSGDGTIKVGYIEERGEYIHNRYQSKITYGTSSPSSSSMDVGDVYIEIE